MKAAAILVLLFGCASRAELDRSRLNHPGMDLSKNPTRPVAQEISPLGSLEGGGAAGACATCAH